jgi:hypothetical protein
MNSTTKKARIAGEPVALYGGTRVRHKSNAIRTTADTTSELKRQCNECGRRTCQTCSLMMESIGCAIEKRLSDRSGAHLACLYSTLVRKL